MRADELGFRTRRFGPSAIGTAPASRALWSLKAVPCCTEQWEYLVDACACGAVQRWQSADRLDRCDVCNARLSDTPACKVDPALREGLAFIIGLLDPDPSLRAVARAQLPKELSHLDGGMALELALAVMPLASGGHRPARGSLPKTGAEQVEYATALAVAADVLRGWPCTFLSAIEAAVATLSRSSRKPGYVGIADYVPAMANPELPAVVREAVLKALEPITADPGETPDDQIGMKAAQVALGVSLGIFSGARREHLLQTRTCFRGGKLVATLDRAEMDHIRQFKANRISAEMAAEGLELPGYAITLMDDARRIAIEPHVFILAHYGDPQLHRDELARFERLLAGKAVAVAAEDDELSETLRTSIGDPVPLHRVARAMGGGLKPWGIIVGMLLDGSMRFFMSAPRMSRIWIDAGDVEKVRALGPSTTGSALMPARCSQRDALEILNLPLRKAAQLARLARPNDRWQMEWETVLRIARERITLTEMCARTSMQSKTLLKKLKPFRLPSDDFGWWRAEAIDALKRLR